MRMRNNYDEEASTVDCVRAGVKCKTLANVIFVKLKQKRNCLCAVLHPRITHSFGLSPCC